MVRSQAASAATLSPSYASRLDHLQNSNVTHSHCTISNSLQSMLYYVPHHSQYSTLLLPPLLPSFPLSLATISSSSNCFY